MSEIMNQQHKIVIASSKKNFFKGVEKKLKHLATFVLFFSPHGLAKQILHEAPDCVLLGMDGLDEEASELIEAIKRFDDNLPIIVLSPSEKIEDVVKLMRQGIYDYFTLPADLSRLENSIQNAIRMYTLTKRIFLLENQMKADLKLDEIIGTSSVMQTVFQTIRNVAGANATVLITGPSGVGKELVAKAIHRLSKRKDRRFLDINCAAIPKELLENELFGHERGAYTGADRRYIGCFERADGGTLFLDEMSEMELALQVKLLRFLQEKQFYRVGGTEPIHVDVAIVAATNQNLLECVGKGTFREDLFYRLNVVQIAVPALKDRKEDIPLLAKHFLEKYARKNDKLFLDFTPHAMEILLQYEWPGNVRELENTIERCVVLHNDTKVKPNYLPGTLQKPSEKSGEAPQLASSEESLASQKVLPLETMERYIIEAALKVCTGNVGLAARQLKIGQATLYRKIKQYGLRY